MGNKILGALKRMIRGADARPSRAQIRKIIPEISDAEISVLEKFAPFTMTSIERQWALISAVRHVNAAKLPGDFVECGVWRGGNVMIAKELNKSSGLPRKFYLYDT